MNKEKLSALMADRAKHIKVAPEVRFKGTPKVLRHPWKPGPLKRECGPCTACCVALPIKDPDLTLAPGEACKHICESGCGIWGKPERPAICAPYACNWLRGHGSHDQRPDRMRALPTLAQDAKQCALYLDEGLTPETMTKAARAYIRSWHRQVGSAVLVLHGVGYNLVTAHFPDGTVETEATTYDELAKSTMPDPPRDPRKDLPKLRHL